MFVEPVKKLGLTTEASKRFERGTDPNNVIRALDKAASLIASLGEGEVVKGIIDTAKRSFDELELTLRVKRTNDLLGTEISINEMEQLLKRLDFKVSQIDADLLKVIVPTYRTDITQEIDLVEEVARIFGYNNLPKPQARYSSSRVLDDPIYLFERKVRTLLTGEGLQELLNCDLIGPKQTEAWESQLNLLGESVKVKNPTSMDQSVLRRSLLPGILTAAQYNRDHQNQDLSGFELGRIHYKENDVFKEDLSLGLVLTGSQGPFHWDRDGHKVDFFDLKGILENLTRGLGIYSLEFRPSKQSLFHPGQQAEIFVNDKYIGVIGTLHSQAARELGIEDNIYIAELNLQTVFALSKTEVLVTEIPSHPCTERDWTVTLRKSYPIQDVLKVLKKVPSKIIEEIHLLDIYESERLGTDRKNVTFRIIYRAKNKTISHQVVEKDHERLIQTASRELAEAFVI